MQIESYIFSTDSTTETRRVYTSSLAEVLEWDRITPSTHAAARRYYPGNTPSLRLGTDAKDSANGYLRQMGKEKGCKR